MTEKRIEPRDWDMAEETLDEVAQDTTGEKWVRIVAAYIGKARYQERDRIKGALDAQGMLGLTAMLGGPTVGEVIERQPEGGAE